MNPIICRKRRSQRELWSTRDLQREVEQKTKKTSLPPTCPDGCQTPSFFFHPLHPHSLYVVRHFIWDAANRSCQLFDLHRWIAMNARVSPVKAHSPPERRSFTVCHFLFGWFHNGMITVLCKLGCARCQFEALKNRIQASHVITDGKLGILFVCSVSMKHKTPPASH